MKPFNLEEFKAGKPALRRDGAVARFEAYVADAEESNRLVYSALNKDCFRCIYTVCPTGSYCRTGIPVCELDLIGMASTKRTIYVNLLSGGTAFWFSREHDAKMHASELQHTAIKTVQVEIEE